MNQIAEYKKARKAAGALVQEKDSIAQECRRETDRVYREYSDKMQAIEDKRNAVIRKVEKKANDEKAALQRQIEEQYVLINQVKRTLELIDVSVHEEKCKNVAPLVYQFSDKDEEGNWLSKKRKVAFEPVKTLYADQYRKVYVYLVPTQKPANKLALFIVGFTFFGYSRKLFDDKWASINGIHEESANIRIVAREGRTEKDLLAWLEKNEQKVYDMVPNFDELIRDYEEAKKLKGQKQWQIAYLEYKKEYYETQYSHGEETEEYKMIVRELQKLRG